MSKDENKQQDEQADWNRQVANPGEGWDDSSASNQGDGAPQWELEVIMYICVRPDAKADLKKHQDLDEILQEIEDITSIQTNIEFKSNHRLNFFDSHHSMIQRQILQDKESNPTRNIYGSDSNQSWVDLDKESLFRLVAIDVCRLFLVEVCYDKEHGKLDIRSDDMEILSEICTRSLRKLESTHTQSVHEYRNVAREYLTTSILEMGQRIPGDSSTRWKLVACLLRACPTVEEDATFPAAFSVEEVGRDGWILTTYGKTPLRHVIRPLVPMILPTDTYLAMNVRLKPVGFTRQLRMLDVS